LIREIQSTLPKLFGFEGVGIMFRDIKTGNMFTISGKLDEEEAKAEDIYFDKKRKNLPTTKAEDLMEFER